MRQRARWAEWVEAGADVEDEELDVEPGEEQHRRALHHRLIPRERRVGGVEERSRGGRGRAGWWSSVKWGSVGSAESRGVGE